MTPLGVVNVGVEVAARRRCGEAVGVRLAGLRCHSPAALRGCSSATMLRSVAGLAAWRLVRCCCVGYCCVPGSPRRWGYVGAPTILRHFQWWRSLLRPVMDEAGAGFQGALRLVVGRFVRRMGVSVSPDKYYPIATTTDHPLVCRSGAHSCGDAHHNCTFVRFCARAREDVQGVDQGSNRRHTKSIDSGHVLVAINKRKPTKQHSPAVCQVLMTRI